jgi:hypothetical protein
MCGYYEKKLLNDLIADYNALERPVVNESEPLLVSMPINTLLSASLTHNLLKLPMFIIS